MEKFVFYIFYAVVRALSLLPFRVLYVISDIIYFLSYHVVKYRRRVVEQNLRNSFPEMSVQARRRIEKEFFRHLADILLETIKLLHVEDEEIKKRMVFSNPEVLSRFTAGGQSVIVLLGHYGNWEWIPSIYMNYQDLVGGELYRPMKNQYFDSFFKRLRSRFGTINMPKNDAFREIVKLRQEGKVFALGFIADQTPSKNNLHYWTTFLNQETPFLNGPERIARKGDYAVVYFDVQKTSRGHYQCDLVTLTEHAKGTKENEITDQYVELFERTILRNPAYWLWSHKRWKHQREDGQELRARK